MSANKTVFVALLLSSTLAPLLAKAQTAPPEPALSERPAVPSAKAPADSEFSDARRLAKQGKYDEAIQELNRLAKTSPKGIDREIGFVQYVKGDYAGAMSTLKAAVAKNDADQEAVQLLGLSSYLAGHPAEAIPYLERVQSWFPRANVDAAYILGICYIQTKDYPKARTAFARMFDVPADSAASYLFTARMLLRQEFDPVAEEYAQKAVSVDAKLPGAHQMLGELYIFKSRIPEAIEQFQKELAINPDSAATYYKLADAFSRVQKYDDAERLLQRSIWLDASSTGPYILMGKVLEKKGEYELALRALRHASAMDPNNNVAHHLLGQTYRDLGMRDEAEAELKLAEQLRAKQDSRQ